MDYGTFNYRLNGFKNPPSTLYPKPMWLAWNQDYHPYWLCSVEQNMEILREFSNMFERYGRFAFGLSSQYLHDRWNNLQVLDDAIVKQINYYKNEGNTMFVLLGDHGSRAGELRESLQGMLEERLPFLSITFPRWFKYKYPQLFDTLKHNRDLLITYFDVYATFRHILTYPLPPGPDVGGQSLFTRLPLNRTCASEGIAEHWCACLAYQDVSVEDPIVQRIGREIVSYMNRLLVEQKSCAHINLERVLKAGVQIPNEKLQKFKDTKRDEVCDSCGVVLDESVETHKASIKTYQLVLTASPSGGKFEGNANVNSRGEITVDPLISRTNFYGDQPKCIATTFPHLRPFCYCL